MPSVAAFSDNHMLHFAKLPFRWHTLTLKETVVSKDKIHWRFHRIILMIELHLQSPLFPPHPHKNQNLCAVWTESDQRWNSCPKKNNKTIEGASFSAHRETWRYQAWHGPVALSAFQYQLSIHIINCCSTLRDTQGTNEPQISSLNMATGHQILLSTTKSMTLAK